MRALTVLLLWVTLVGCANSLTKEQSATLEATFNVLMIGVGVASLVTGNPDGVLGTVFGATAVADGTLGLVFPTIEQAQAEAVALPEPLCLCPYPEPQ